MRKKEPASKLPTFFDSHISNFNISLKDLCIQLRKFSIYFTKLTKLSGNRGIFGINTLSRIRSRKAIMNRLKLVDEKEKDSKEMKNRVFKH